MEWNRGRMEWKMETGIETGMEWKGAEWNGNRNRRQRLGVEWNRDRDQIKAEWNGRLDYRRCN